MHVNNEITISQCVSHGVTVLVNIIRYNSVNVIVNILYLTMYVISN